MKGQLLEVQSGKEETIILDEDNKEAFLEYITSDEEGKSSTRIIQHITKTKDSFLDTYIYGTDLHGKMED